MASNTLRDKLMGVHTRIDLKHFLRETYGLSANEAAAKVREWFSADDQEEESAESVPAKSEELTRAGLARAFRDSREQAEKRLQFLGKKVFRHKYGFDPRGDDPRGDECRHMAAELAAQLDACKSLDELEAKLIRLDWPEHDVKAYLMYFSESGRELTRESILASLTPAEIRKLKKDAELLDWTFNPRCPGQTKHIEGIQISILDGWTRDPGELEAWRKKLQLQASFETKGS